VHHEPELVEEPVAQQRPDERAPLPRIVMSLPGCRFSTATLSATSPLMRAELFHSRGSSRVFETTYLRTLLMWSTIGVPPGWLGQKAALSGSRNRSTALGLNRAFTMIQRRRRSGSERRRFVREPPPGKSVRR
jgi:hypothetical protein